MNSSKQNHISSPSKQINHEMDTNNECVLILCNDDFNTFDFVITTLISVCNHDSIQAHQCAILTHLKGECDVKTGEIAYLVDLKRALTNRGLTAIVKET